MSCAPADRTIGSLIARLSSVSTLLDRSGLTFDDLKELVDARFLYRAKPDPETSRTMRLPSLRMAPLAGTDPCDIDNLWIGVEK